MAEEFTEAELAAGMRKLLDGTWRLKTAEIDTEIDRVTYYEIVEGTETLSTTYDRLEVALARALKRSLAQGDVPKEKG